MIFNLNEQKVLSDPSGSSVFKGEKDFNDIVVNLPDNIDGHTATELKYVMHFVDSDGGYSTKILTVDSSGEALKATATVSTSITSKAQAFYTYVLMTDDEETVIGKTNGVIVMIHPVPDEENEIIPPADADKIIKGLEEIVKEATETIETATDTIEEATEAISSKQDKLTAGENITIDEDNVISAEGGDSQIVSGVVNANGTITFTDSDGNTFTTTGSGVIGADGIGIADVHIDGGGDLIIEYTTGRMENIGHVVGTDGQDYVLTAQDKSDIADIVLGELPNADTMSF